MKFLIGVKESRVVYYEVIAKDQGQAELEALDMAAMGVEAKGQPERLEDHVYSVKEL